MDKVSSAADKKMRGEMKAVRLTASIVAMFIILWTPYITGRLIQVIGIQPLLGQYVSDIGIILITINSSINWILYGLSSSVFRKAVKSIFGRQDISSSINQPEES